MLRVRQLQPAHAPPNNRTLWRKFKNLLLECDLSVFNFSINVSCLYCVFCVEYFRLPHTHSCSTCIINFLVRIGHCLFVGWFVFHCHGNEIKISSMMADIEGI